MIEKWLKLLGGFIVDRAFQKLGIPDDFKLDDLLAKAATVFKAELAEDLDKLDDIPQQIIKEIGDLPGQVVSRLPDSVNQFRTLINQAMAALPFPFNQFQI